MNELEPLAVGDFEVRKIRNRIKTKTLRKTQVAQHTYYKREFWQPNRTWCLITCMGQWTPTFESDGVLVEGKMRSRTFIRCVFTGLIVDYGCITGLAGDSRIIKANTTNCWR